MIRKLAQEEGDDDFLCTHQLRYAQEICTSYGLIDKGAPFAMGTLEQLRAKIHSGMTVKIETNYMPDSVSYRKSNKGCLKLTFRQKRNPFTCEADRGGRWGYLPCFCRAANVGRYLFQLDRKRKGNE